MQRTRATLYAGLFNVGVHYAKMSQTEDVQSVAEQGQTRAPIPAVEAQPQQAGGTQTRFRINLPSDFQSASSRESVYLEWSLFTTPTDIDGNYTEDPIAASEMVPDSDGELSDKEEDFSTDDEGGKKMDQDEIDDIQTRGRMLEDSQSINRPAAPLSNAPQIPIPSSSSSEPASQQTVPIPLPGYKYTEFVPDTSSYKTKDVYLIPTQSEAKSALEDLTNFVHPKQSNDHPDLDLWRRVRIEGMVIMLNLFTNPNSRTYNEWGVSACQAAIGLGRGNHCARRLCELNRAYLSDRNLLPLNPYGDWNRSLLVNENIVNEISIFLLSLGNDITAGKLMEFLHRPDIKEKYAIDRNITHKTACRYLQALGYRYRSTPKGQYADGHERDDVVVYRNTVFLPKWKNLSDRMATWDRELKEYPPTSREGRRVIVWFHDESIFYANDRRKKGWYHKDASAKPYAKGEGASLMVARFVSAEFGWLTSLGTKTAQRLFKPGKNRDGYFTSDDIISQADDAMDIVLEKYPDFDHVFVYDNAPTHLKRADDAISARKMPKGIPKAGSNWGIEVSRRHPDTGRLMYSADGKVEKTKILMKDGRFENGEPQSFYFPMDHPNKDLRGVFKGMAVILEERGFTNISNVRAECKGFKCLPGATNCCCRRILYNQPDFAEGESLLETHCRARGVEVIFLPKFHCELNFIEQCWGRAKSVYRTYRPSSKEEDLERNTLTSLDSIPLDMMKRFAMRARRFMNAYARGLNGKQAAWAARKYRGHRVLPENLLEEMEKDCVG